MKIDSFVLAIILTIIIAYFFPQLGSTSSSIPVDTITSIGVSLIFFFYGLKLSTDDIQSGVKNWKLHLLVQSSTFILFPLIVLVFYPFVQGTTHETLWLSLLFMSALPSTVSSSVVMISLAKGNIPGGIFNASLSGILGILLTPLWMGFFMKDANNNYDFTEIYLQLSTEILLPLIIGLSLRKYLRSRVLKNSKYLSLFDKFIILLIIYKSFVHSFEEKIFDSMNIQGLIIMGLSVTSLFFCVYYITGQLAKKLNMNREDRITAQYCGTKKSLVHGTVFSKALFAPSNMIGLMLLPLMLFHAIQILIISILATKEGKKLTQSIPD